MVIAFDGLDAVVVDGLVVAVVALVAVVPADELAFDALDALGVVVAVVAAVVAWCAPAMAVVPAPTAASATPPATVRAFQLRRQRALVAGEIVCMPVLNGREVRAGSPRCERFV